MKKWDSKDVAKVRELLERGMSARQVGDYLDVTKNAVLGLIARHPFLRAYYTPKSPDALEKRRNRMRSQAKREPASQRNYVNAAATDAEAYRQFAAMPKHETRSLTGIMMGDPPAHRSALYAKMKEAQV